MLPSLVSGSDTKTLNYAGLSVVAIGAVQELKQQKDAEIAALRADNAELRESNEGLSERLARLEALFAEFAGN